MMPTKPIFERWNKPDRVEINGESIYQQPSLRYHLKFSDCNVVLCGRGIPNVKSGWEQANGHHRLQYSRGIPKQLCYVCAQRAGLE